MNEKVGAACGGACVMLLIGLSMAGSYFAVDSLSSVGAAMQREVAGMTSTRWGLLSSAYAFGPIAGLTLVGGMLSDTFGMRTTSLLFAVLVALGQTMLVLCADIASFRAKFALMVIAWAVFGTGAENLTVTLNAALNRWFGSSCLSLACAVTSVVNRCGSIAAFSIAAGIAESHGYRDALFIATCVCYLQLVVNVVRCLVDRSMDPSKLLSPFLKVLDVDNSARPYIFHHSPFPLTMWRFSTEALIPKASPPPPQSELPPPPSSTTTSFSVKDRIRNCCTKVLSMGARFWLLCVACTCFYVVWQFASFCVLFVLAKHPAYSEARAGRVASSLYYAPMVVSPVLGIVVDAFGHRATALCTAFGLLGASHSMLAFGPAALPPEVPIALLGLAYSLFNASLWPCVPLTVPERSVGLAYGVIEWALNIACMVSPIVYGALHDHHGSYLLGEILFVAFAVLGLFATALLLVVDRRRYNGVIQHPTRKTQRQ